MALVASKPPKRLVGALGCALAVGLTFAAGAPAPAAEPASGCGEGQMHVTVVAESLRNAKGQITAELYPDDPTLFLAKGAKLVRVRVPAAGSTVSVCLPIAAPGAYAAVVYHDEDGDGRFDRNVLGLPTEGFGISNNPPLALSQPTLQQARFQAGSGETTVRIRMRYLLGGRMP